MSGTVGIVLVGADVVCSNVVYLVFLSYGRSSSGGSIARVVVAGSIPRLSLARSSLARVSRVKVKSVTVTSAFLVVLRPSGRSVLGMCDLPALQFTNTYRGVKKNPGRVMCPTPFARSFGGGNRVYAIVHSCRGFATLLGLARSLTRHRAICSRGCACRGSMKRRDFQHSSVACLLKSSVLLLGRGPNVHSTRRRSGSLFRICSCQRSGVIHDFCTSSFPSVMGGVGNNSTF